MTFRRYLNCPICGGLITTPKNEIKRYSKNFLIANNYPTCINCRTKWIIKYHIDDQSYEFIKIK